MNPIIASSVRPLRRLYWRLRQSLSSTPFDEQFYLAAYPDVAMAVAAGDRFVSAFQHYWLAGAGEKRAALPRAGAQDAAFVPVVEKVFLELTTRCNLRCVYCPVSQPAYLNIDFSLDRFDDLFEEMKRRRVQVVQINGHGESTIVKGWDALADRLIDAGFRLEITTNLAKRLTPSEVAALSRFEKIFFSIDTVDAALLAQMRRGSNLETILNNLEAVREFAAKRSRSPELSVSVVVSDASVHTLGEMADLLLSRGVRIFRFGDLVEYPPIEGAMAVRHISSMDEEQLARAGRSFRAMLQRIAAQGGVAEVDPPIAALLVHGKPSQVQSDRRDLPSMAKAVHHDVAAERQTRSCLDPWQIAFIHATGAVRPCCFYEEHLGMLGEQSLEEIWNGEGFQDLRRALLSGDLPASCRGCQSRPLADRDELQARVQHYLSGLPAGSSA